MTDQGLHEIDAMGVKCSISAWNGVLSEHAVSRFLEGIEEMDRVASRFREDSELTRVFGGPVNQDLQVSPLLFHALEAAIFAANITGGYLDPTVGDVLRGLGYRGDFDSREMSRFSKASPFLRSPVTGYRNIHLDHTKRTVRFARKITVDLGCTGKAFIADHIKRRVESDRGECILVNLGGDISASVPPADGCWTIKIATDGSSDLDAPGPVIAFGGGGIVTSSTLRRSWLSGGERVHHIIDPFTGRSADSEFATVTVAAASALHANIASTACIAMGHRGADWLSTTGLPSFATTLDGGERFFGGWAERYNALVGREC